MYIRDKEIREKFWLKFYENNYIDAKVIIHDSPEEIFKVRRKKLIRLIEVKNTEDNNSK